MSSTQLIKGLFIKISIQDMTLEEACHAIYGVNEPLPYWANNFIDALLDDDDKYFIANNELYKIIVKNNLEDNNFCHIESISSNTYSFITQFYDGATCLHEMLHEKLESCDK